jgi:hypothetical protein
MIGTLTLSKSNFVHKSTSLIILYKSRSVATPDHLKPLILENYVRIVALGPDLRAASFYNVREFLLHSSTIELIVLLILMKGYYLSYKASLLCTKSSSAFPAVITRRFI